MKNKQNPSADTIKTHSGQQQQQTPPSNSPFELSDAIKRVKAEVVRLGTALRAEKDEAKKAALVAEMTALMASVGLDYEGDSLPPPAANDAEPAAASTEGDKEPAAEKAKEETPAAAKDEPGFFARMWSWIKDNKVKTVAIVASIAATVAGIWYAMRSGRTDAVAELAEGVTKHFSDTSALPEGGAEPGLMSRIGDKIASIWNTVCEYAVAGKDKVVDWFSRSPAPAELVAA